MKNSNNIKVIRAIASACFLLFGSIMSSCSLGNSLTTDLNSSNPAIAEQAQRVQSLEQQVRQQESVTETEKQRLEGLKQQLEGAKQNLKGLKTQAKAS
jgi:5-bromo-4-chloroindolyl phosphate hydrolysis protein